MTLVDTPAPTKGRDGDDRELISAADVKRRYGDVSHMWIERRLANPDSGFPRPLYVGDRRYSRLSELVAWEHSLPRARPRKPEAV